MAFKITFVGDTNVGKTSIIKKYQANEMNNSYNQDIKPTICPTYDKFEIILGDQIVRLFVWDTAGQEQYHPLVPFYTRNSALVVLVFDMNNKKSFDNIDNWYNQLKYKLELTCPVVLVGNKIDLKEVVSRHEAESWANSKEIPVFYTSALQNENIVSLFYKIAEIVSQHNEIAHDDEPNIDLNEHESKKSCC